MAGEVRAHWQPWAGGDVSVRVVGQLPNLGHIPCAGRK